MSSFTITTPETSVNLRPSSVKPGGKAKGTATYTVMNTSGSTKKVKLSVEPGPGADRGWFTVRDGESRELAPGATTTFSVDLEVPGGSANHSFKGIAVNERDTDNDFEVGSTIAFDAPAIEENGGVKWWMIAAPIALLLVVGVAIAWFIGRDKPEPEPEEGVIIANFVDSPLEEAKAALEAQGITVVEKAMSTSAPEFDRQKFYDRIVAQQTPASDGSLEVQQGTSVELGWQWSPKMVTVPTLKNRPFGQAVSEIEKAGLRYVGLIGPHGNQPAKHYAGVQSWSPAGRQEAGTGITLTMTWVPAPDRFTAEQLEQLHNVFIQKKDAVTPAWRGRPIVEDPTP